LGKKYKNVKNVKKRFYTYGMNVTLQVFCISLNKLTIWLVNMLLVCRVLDI